MQNQSKNKTSRVALAAGLGFVGLSSIAGAQELFGSFSDYSQASGYELQDEALIDSERFEFFKYGVRAGVTFDDNIFLSDDGEESDAIYTADVILSLKNRSEAANAWVLTYIPSFKFYADNSGFDSVNHNVNAGFSKVLPKTQLDFSADFADISGSNRFVAGQVDKTTFGAEFSVSHILTGKTRADFDLDFRSDDYDGDLVGRDRLSSRLAWIHQLTGKVSVGPYIGYEYTDVDGGADHEAVSFGASFGYQALAKTSLNGFFGAETRSFDGGQSDKTSSVFSVGARHQYSGKTSFDASVYRRVTPSYSGGNDSYTATGVYIGGNYAATDRVKLHSRFNFERDSYFGETAGVSARDNDYFSFTVGGDYAMNNGLKLGADVTLREKNAENGNSDFSNVLLQVDATYYF